ncbi:MAG: hypothetical protein HKN91_02290 [Acidimicrobiia bacterium]|nr:hypothetical protein [Acidimicrobiia bacterium]
MKTFIRFASFALVASLVVVFAPGAASACSCMPVTTRDMVAEAEIAFEGEEISRISVDVQAWASVAVTFQVIEAYKGEVTEQITVLTGESSAGCGVGPTSGVIGVTIRDGAEPSINICGSIHQAGAIASILDPIDIVTAAPGPSLAPTSNGGFGGVVVAAAVAVILAGIGIAVVRRRREDWQDGWSSEG